jgi:hypothetical protein
LKDVRLELAEGRGIVMLQGFPVERFDVRRRAIAYLGIGAYLGDAMSQNGQGHILGHVKSFGADYADPLVRPYRTRAQMEFHTDNCDYVGLLCVCTAREGGESMVASSVTVYNRMLQSRPDLVEVLIGDFYRSRYGETNPGEPNYYIQPMFTFHNGYFSAVGAGASVEKAQGMADVPQLTPLQKEAIRVYRETASECAAAIPFLPGDIQFLNNRVTLHSRRAYVDWPEESRRRHLLRLWLRDPHERRLPADQKEGFIGKGIVLAGVMPVAPLDVYADELTEQMK